ncbi:MAG: HEPN domain-containing protein [Campylobacterota bacterium]|nr:HEPN domain-containing protein [Campylobacterota bacterium]
MANKTYAKEWLTFAIKNLNTAILLHDANHYEDIIGVELQQALEKTFKSILANENIKIPKDHDLVKLYFMVEKNINIEEDEIIFLRLATDYYKEDRYPNPNYSLPSKGEIKEVLSFTQNFFDKVCRLLDITKADLI